MKTRHNPKIKRLSTAIKRGLKIAEERGITHMRGELLEVDYHSDNKPKVCRACALGFAYLGKFGIAQAIKTEGNYTQLDEAFPDITAASACFAKKVEEVDPSLGDPVFDVSSMVMSLNDNFGKKPAEIAELLESCNL